MSTHNVDLPTHRYVWVRSQFVYNDGPNRLVPAVWFGMSSHPGRSLGCHVMLENGATVIDLPLIALASSSDASVEPSLLHVLVAWDSFGWQMEAYEPDYLTGLRVAVLNSDHATIAFPGTAWFAVDWIENGWSDYPEQHKWLWIVANDAGDICAMPQDRVLFREKSFTDNFSEIPKGGIKRQTVIWKAEE